MTDSADHISAKTGLTTTVTISKNGGSFASPSGAVSEIANGWYKVAGNATDTNTLGPLALHATATGADACDIIVANIVSYNPQSATNLGLSALPTANPGAANGVLIAGTNVATTFNGTAASGATPATAGITITGGAASTTGGGTSAAAIIATGGAGAASTNGAAAGATFAAGGTTTVSGNDGITFTGTGNGNGATLAKAGSGKDFNATSTPLTLAKTTNITGFNDITAAAAATGVWTDTTAGDFTVALSVGKSVMNGVSLGTGLTVNALTTNNDKTGYSLTAAYDPAKTASQAGDAMALTSAERNSTADALLARNVAGGSSTGRLVKEALYVLRNKTDIQSGTLTVYGTDDSTAAFTAAVTKAPGDPITTIDPA